MKAEYLILIIGFIAQLLFSGRFLWQWIVSEKNKKVVIPKHFWLVSLIASFLLFVYGYLREDFPIMMGQTLTYFIYIRNLQLEKKWQDIPLFWRVLFWIFPIGVVVYYYNNGINDISNLFNNPEVPFKLLLLGIVSQLTFKCRFIYQWIYSERKKESSLPLGFWVISLAGSLLIIIYAILRKDPVLIIGHITGIITYSRNIILYRKSKQD